MKLVQHRDGLALIAVPSPTIPPATTTNAWIIGKKHRFIIDPAAHREQTQQELLSLLQPLSIHGIVLTHHHNDHIASAVFLSENLYPNTIVPIYAHPHTATLLPFVVHHLLQHNDVLYPDQDAGEELLEGWRVIHTPGHAPGHICLHSDADASLIAGDMVAGEGTILIQPKEGSIREYIRSLLSLQERQPSKLLPAHGPILDNPADTLQQYIDHRLHRVAQIYDILSSKAQQGYTPEDIAAIIYADLPKQFLRIASIQVECGLLYLAEDGVVGVSDGVWTCT